MIDILWHGRGGQGAFTAARLLGAAVSLSEGTYALAFPSFGPERRGAPMRAFTKFAQAPVGDRSAITRADYIVYLDETLFDAQNEAAWSSELKPNGIVLVNSARDFSDTRVVSIDASGISEQILGRPIPNTALLGALSILCAEIDAEKVIEAIRQYMPKKLHEKNERIVDVARTQMMLRNVSRETLHAADATEALRSSVLPSTQMVPDEFENVDHDAISETRGFPLSDVVRECQHIPRLRSQLVSPPSLDPGEYAKSTCYAAGHLVTKNAGWRNVRPVVDASSCTGCLQCYLYCPDGTVYKVKDDSAIAKSGGGEEGEHGGVGSHCGENPPSVAGAHGAAGLCGVPPAPSATSAFGAAIAIDYDFCKGCGICAKVCKFGAIEMIPEAQVRTHGERVPAHGERVPAHDERVPAHGEPASAHDERVPVHGECAAVRSDAPHVTANAEQAESHAPIRGDASCATTNKKPAFSHAVQPAISTESEVSA